MVFGEGVGIIFQQNFPPETLLSNYMQHVSSYSITNYQRRSECICIVSNFILVSKILKKMNLHLRINQPKKNH